MLTVFSMLLIVAFLGYLAFLPDTKGKTNRFFDLNTTTAMRGFWCLIVVLVHVPEAGQNRIQDLIGSFAYIGVTFFFMTSGYGLMLAAKKTEDGQMLHGFWKRRLPKLLVPMLIANLLATTVDAMAGEVRIQGIFSLNPFVKQLLLFYLVFWAIFHMPILEIWKKRIVYVAVVIISLLIYFADAGGWAVEAFGFLYGIFLPDWIDKLSEKAKQYWGKGIVALIICCLCLGVLYLKAKYVAFLGDYLLKIALGIAILLLILWGNVKYPVGNVAGKFLGKISYEVYLIHGVVFEQFRYILTDVDSGCYIIISIIATVLLSMAIYGISRVILSCGNKGAMSV